MLAEFQALHLQLNQDPAGLTALWFTIEDSEIVKLDEVEMILDETTLLALHLVLKILIVTA